MIWVGAIQLVAVLRAQTSSLGWPIACKAQCHGAFALDGPRLDSLRRGVWWIQPRRWDWTEGRRKRRSWARIEWGHSRAREARSDNEARGRRDRSPKGIFRDRECAQSEEQSERANEARTARLRACCREGRSILHHVRRCKVRRSCAAAIACVRASESGPRDHQDDVRRHWSADIRPGDRR